MRDGPLQELRSEQQLDSDTTFFQVCVGLSGSHISAAVGESGHTGHRSWWNDGVPWFGGFKAGVTGQDSAEVPPFCILAELVSGLTRI